MKKKHKEDDTSGISHRGALLKERIRKMRCAIKEEAPLRKFSGDVTFLSAGIEIFSGVVLSFLCCWGVGELFNFSLLVRCLGGLVFSFFVLWWSVYKKVRKMP